MTEGAYGQEGVRPRDDGDKPDPKFAVMPATMAMIRRGDRTRLEVMGPHPHPLLVPTSAEAAKMGKRARLCACPPCRKAFDYSL